MMKKTAILVSAALACAASAFASAKVAKPVSEDFKRSVIYQILLPSFTQEGTLNKAAEMLPYVKSLGVDIVYLCPLTEHDDDMDKTFWSERQKAAKTENPKNPYRMKDFYKIDPSYGTADDARNFVKKAHELGLKVLFDVVYYHCGPKAVFLKDHPDFIMRKPDGSPDTGEWAFPRLNFKNPELREYLTKNMEFLLREFDIDGFRTDVGEMVPSDFWDNAAVRLRKIKPELLMIEESERHSATEKTYDATYEVLWQRKTIEVFHDKKPAKILRERWESFDKDQPKNARVLRAMENHDFANGPFRKRCEIRFGYRGMDAVMVMNFTLDGIPFIYSGNEFADDAPMTIFSDRTHGRYFTEWANMNTEQGKRRTALVKKLIELRKDPVFFDGKTRWIDNDKPDAVLSFARETKDGAALVVINAADSKISTLVDFDTRGAWEIISYGTQFEQDGNKTKLELQPKGYIVLRKSAENRKPKVLRRNRAPIM